jgi:hypothetical protein
LSESTKFLGHQGLCGKELVAVDGAKIRARGSSRNIHTKQGEKGARLRQEENQPIYERVGIERRRLYMSSEKSATPITKREFKGTLKIQGGRFQLYRYAGFSGKKYAPQADNYHIVSMFENSEKLGGNSQTRERTVMNFA